MPAPITGAGSIPPATPPTTSVDRPDQLGKDTFLKLLVAQLKYQNPMNPADSNEFLAQSAQFTMLEKLEQIARQGAERATAESVSTASGLLGRRVTWSGSDGAETSGIVTSSRLGPGGVVLLVGDTEVPITAIRGVRPASATPA